MKLTRKGTLLLTLAIILVGISVAYAAFTVYSNVKYVKMDYAVSLDASQSGSVVTLTAHLTDRGNPVSGKTVYFYTCDSGGGNRALIGSDDTDGGGDAVLAYSVTANGDYYFIAGYDVP